MKDEQKTCLKKKEKSLPKSGGLETKIVKENKNEFCIKNKLGRKRKVFRNGVSK